MHFPRGHNPHTIAHICIRDQVFESEYKSDMSVDEAKALVHAGIMAGINNDLGSGGSVDMMVIDETGHTPLRNYSRPNERKYVKQGGYVFERGTAKVRHP